MNPLEPLKRLHRDLQFRAKQCRRDAETLIAKAEVYEIASVDLDIAIGNLERSGKVTTSVTTGGVPE